MKVLIITAFLISSAYAQKRVEIKYEKRQKIDLGALTIDGEIVSPGDFSVDDEKGEVLKDLFRRKNYNDRLKVNIDYVL